jgi:hypothetical protein
MSRAVFVKRFEGTWNRKEDFGKKQQGRGDEMTGFFF